MLLKYYKITLLNPEIPGDTRAWMKAAPDIESAWRKFVVQHFGILKPKAADYDIHFDHTRSV